MRRTDRERSYEFALEALNAAPYVNVAFAGDAYAVPMVHYYEDGCIYFHCAHEGEKIERIKKNPRVCITAVGEYIPRPGKFGCDYKSAIFFADAEFVTDEAEKMRLLVAITAKHAPAIPDRMEKYAKGFLERTTLLRMRIVSGTGKECIKK